MLTTEQVNEAIADCLPNVLAGLRNEIQERALSEAKRVAIAEVNAVVVEWVKKNVVPEVHKTLTESKDGLVAMADDMAAGITQALADALTDQLKQKLKNSWERKKIFEALIA